MFAPQEQSVRLFGCAARRPTVTAEAGSAGEVAFDNSTGRFEVSVSPSPEQVREGPGNDPVRRAIVSLHSRQTRMTTRRDVLQIGACVATSAAMPAALASNARPKTILILGGTGFIGPHLTQQSLRLGWQVTHFNRGKRAAGGVAGVETLIGDRKGQLDSLRGRTWDVVVDDTGYIPKFVKNSAELLAPNVGYCLFISSISAYASFAQPNDEHSPTGKLSNPDTEEVTDDTYGPMKALCEQYST